MKSLFFLIILLSFFLCSCTKTVNNVQEYLDFLQEKSNGFNSEKNIGNITIKTTYMPKDLLAYIEYKSSDNKKYKEILNSYGTSEYFKMEVFDNRKLKADLVKLYSSNEEEYEEIDMYLSYKLANDIILIDGKDTVKPALYNYDKKFELNSTICFLISFPICFTKPNDKIFEYSDKVFNLGVNKMFLKIKKTELPEFTELKNIGL